MSAPSELEEIWVRVKGTSERMGKGDWNAIELELKEIEKEVRERLMFLGDMDAGQKEGMSWSEIQVMIFNNLACVYEQ